jgi:site-specific DNA-methyltransferase (adenine-specific)
LQNTVELHLGDCLEVMKSIPDKSVDAVITDPPYNIGKAEWDKIDNYINWCGLWIIECQRVLKDNGSFYFFHNDMEQIADLMIWIRNNTGFVFKQFIVWNKRFDGAKLKGYLDGYVCIEGDRNYRQMAEYCLFYTFQDETGLTTVKLDMNNFSTLRQYFKDYQESLGLSKLDILGIIGQQADHCFRWGSSQWDMPTEETYKKLAELPVCNEFVRREYEDLRREYEDLRYTFNNQKTHHSVWNYEIAPRCDHITPKPVEMIENIIRHSSNDGYTILDPFMGSGTTGVACVQTGRNFIGIEIDEGYFKIAEKRIKDAQQQMRIDFAKN